MDRGAYTARNVLDRDRWLVLEPFSNTDRRLHPVGAGPASPALFFGWRAAEAVALDGAYTPHLRDRVGVTAISDQTRIGGDEEGNLQPALDAAALRALLDAAPDGILVCDEEGNILFANRQTAQLFGYDPATLLGLRVDALLPEHLRRAHRDHRARYHSRPRVRAMGVGLILHGRRADGSEFPVEISLSPLPAADEGQLVVATVRDVRERIATEQRLRRTEQHLRLAEDRERIARELHDVVIQKLFAAGMTVQAVAARTADTSLTERLNTVVDELDETIREIRTAIYGLQAGARNTPGLRADVMRICDEHRDALGFEPRVRFDGPVDTITERVANELLAVVREAISNVARHAHASAVDVSVRHSGDFVTLRVVDDGTGLPEDTTGGQGLPNLSDRAAQLGGRSVLAARPEGGTALEWTVPDLD